MKAAAPLLSSWSSSLNSFFLHRCRFDIPRILFPFSFFSHPRPSTRNTTYRESASLPLPRASSSFQNADTPYCESRPNPCYQTRGDVGGVCTGQGPDKDGSGLCLQTSDARPRAKTWERALTCATPPTRKWPRAPHMTFLECLERAMCGLLAGF